MLSFRSLTGWEWEWSWMKFTIHIFQIEAARHLSENSDKKGWRRQHDKRGTSLHQQFATWNLRSQLFSATDEEVEHFFYSPKSRSFSSFSPRSYNTNGRTRERLRGEFKKWKSCRISYERWILSTNFSFFWDRKTFLSEIFLVAFPIYGMCVL